METAPFITTLLEVVLWIGIVWELPQGLGGKIAHQMRPPKAGSSSLATRRLGVWPSGRTARSVAGCSATRTAYSRSRREILGSTHDYRRSL